MADKFRISFAGEVLCSKDDLWPDGDAPANPTVQDVVRLIRDYPYSTSSLLNDWNLDEELEVWIGSHEVRGADVPAIAPPQVMHAQAGA